MTEVMTVVLRIICTCIRRNLVLCCVVCVSIFSYRFFFYVNTFVLQKTPKAVFEKVIDKSKQVIFMNARNCFQNPVIFSLASPAEHFFQMFTQKHSQSGMSKSDSPYTSIMVACTCICSSTFAIVG